MQPGPSSDEYFFRHEFVPAGERGGDVRLVDSAFVEAMREGWLVMIDEANTARDVALLSINATLDGRLALYLPATAETVVAQPGFAVLLAYNPGLVGATDIPDAWRSRFPATLEVTSNWAALVKLGAPELLVAAAARLDQLRMAGEDGLVWTPQFRDLESLHEMMLRVGERAAIGFFCSNLHEQQAAGTIHAAETAAACRMLDEAGYGHLRVGASRRSPTCTATRGRWPMNRQEKPTAERGRNVARELTRAVAQRGRLESVYQSLSDHWTLILQRLFPVWSVIGPGLADPGHIELTSRTVYLDSDSLLGSREEIITGTLEPGRILATFGVGIHEVLHAKHTKLWVSDRDIELTEAEDEVLRQLAADRQLLEEPRMEANGVREFPQGTQRQVHPPRDRRRRGRGDPAPTERSVDARGADGRRRGSAVTWPDAAWCT